MTSLRNKVVAITGAASGIGRSTAHLLAAHGALLSLADVNEKPLAACSAQLTKQYYQDVDPSARSSRVITTVVDVRSAASVGAWIRKTTTHFGQAVSGAATWLASLVKTLLAKREPSVI